MACKCCQQPLNRGLIYKVDASGRRYKSCPHCSVANGEQHVFHPYPANFGKTPARVSARNPNGDQSYCIDCRQLAKGVASKAYRAGVSCQQLT